MRIGDAFGRALWEYHRGVGPRAHVVERDDGLIDTFDTSLYFAPIEGWHPLERKAIRLARGRVLDVGVGAGRHALYLLERGHEVVGVDTSPLAVRTARARGVDARLLDVARIDGSVGTFDTIMLFGANFGIMGSPARAVRLLRRLGRLANPGARLLAATIDPVFPGAPPEHRRYHARNRARGRLPGQVRIRARYLDEATPWFDWLLVSKRDMERIARDTQWRVARTLDGARGAYVAVLEQTP